jgi:hypothetical protein
MVFPIDHIGQPILGVHGPSTNHIVVHIDWFDARLPF